MASNRGFIWLDDESTNVIAPVRAQPLYYDDAYELTSGHGNVHHNKVIFMDEVTANNTVNVNTLAPISAHVTIDGDTQIAGGTTTETLAITQATNDNTKSQVLVRDSSTGAVYYRDASTLTSTPEFVDDVYQIESAAGNVGEVRVRIKKVHGDYTVRIDDFAAELGSASSYLMIMGVPHDVGETLYRDIIMNIDGVMETCMAEYKTVTEGQPVPVIRIFRNGEADFPAGDVAHGVDLLSNVYQTQHVYTVFPGDE